jgi:hypothetical protein
MVTGQVSIFQGFPYIILRFPRVKSLTPHECTFQEGSWVRSSDLGYNLLELDCASQGPF